MDTRTIRDILGRHDPVTKSRFGGVYPSDKLPIRPRDGELYVINTAPSTHKGEHWVSVYVPQKYEHGCAEYYDSFGLAPFIESIERFMLGVPCGYVMECAENAKLEYLLVGNTAYFI